MIVADLYAVIIGAKKYHRITVLVLKYRKMTSHYDQVELNQTKQAELRALDL